MGTWIEIMNKWKGVRRFGRSFPAMGTWIEIAGASAFVFDERSFPAMGTWIEI